MKTERRVMRSGYRGEAIELALAAAVGRSGSRAAVIADRDGLLVAGVGGAGYNLEELAACAAWNGEGRQGFYGSCSTFRTYPLHVEGHEFRLASIGTPIGDEGFNIADALRRILIET